MTDSPNSSKPVEHVDSATLRAKFNRPEFQKIISKCRLRRIDHREFLGFVKPGHDTTIEEWGEVYTDATGLRAYIFYYLHSDGTKIESIKRMIDDDTDYRIQISTATVKQF